MNLENQTWMEKALTEAKNCRGDVPVGCVVVNDGAIIGAGCNRREELCDPTAHAEILAIRQAAQNMQSWRLDGCAVFVTLEPCPMCAEAIIQARVSRLIFGAYEPLTGAAGSRFNLFEANRSLPLPEVLGGICEEPCRALIQEFFKAKR
jgi:tRNA(adenine34) deaminase